MFFILAARRLRGRFALACAAAFAWPAVHAAPSDGAHVVPVREPVEGGSGASAPTSAAPAATPVADGDTLTAVSVTAQRQH